MTEFTSKNLIAARTATPGLVSESPFGTTDEIGMPNLMAPESTAAAWSAADPTRVYDLSAEYQVGIPSWAGLGDPTYQIWMSHTPAGSVDENVVGLGEEQNQHVTYSGDCIAMYTHTGTHLDALNHFGLNGEVWNHVRADRGLGSRHWMENGAEQHPPVSPAASCSMSPGL